MSTQSLPKHIAFIMDGNGRWAKARGLPRSAGHKKGVEALRRTLDAAQKRGIEVVTIFSFSSENWARPKDEVETLMNMLRQYLKSDITDLHKKGVRVRIIGERARLPSDIRDQIQRVETLTQDNDKMTVVVALSYGARQEIIEAARHMATQAASGALNPQDIDETLLCAHLDTADIPDPDLLIRTSGELRISNFLLWQLAYAELYFTDTLWPDFDAKELDKAIENYTTRERRFGLVGQCG